MVVFYNQNNLYGIMCLRRPCCLCNLFQLRSSFNECNKKNGLIFGKYKKVIRIYLQVVSAKDQLLPLLVIDTLKDFPGAAGLFLAGVFSASLSSLSGGLNSLAAVTLEDCVKPVFTQLSSKQEQIIVKSVVLVTGVVTVGLAVIVAKMGQILQVPITKLVFNSN